MRFALCESCDLLGLLTEYRVSTIHKWIITTIIINDNNNCNNNNNNIYYQYYYYYHYYYYYCYYYYCYYPFKNAISSRSMNNTPIRQTKAARVCSYSCSHDHCSQNREVHLRTHFACCVPRINKDRHIWLPFCDQHNELL